MCLTGDRSTAELPRNIYFRSSLPTTPEFKKNFQHSSRNKPKNNKYNLVGRRQSPSATLNTSRYFSYDLHKFWSNGCYALCHADRTCSSFSLDCRPLRWQRGPGWLWLRAVVRGRDKCCRGIVFFYPRIWLSAPSPPPRSP